MSIYAIPFDVPTISYGEALDVLRGALRFGICPLVETVEDMLAELGDPDLSFASVQIAGTNGKTSTARYTASILAGEGLSVALYTSPELVSYTERMEIAGQPVSGEQFARGIAAAQEAGRLVNARRTEAGERPYDITEFDLLTVAAMVVFAEADVDAAVLEVGLGGRWDATSAVKSIRSVAVTGIGLDHMRILGDTLEEIAREKAAVIRAGRSCVLGVGTATPESVEDVFIDRCAAQGVSEVLLRPCDADDAEGIMHPGRMRTHENLRRASYSIVSRPDRLGASLRLDVRTTRAVYEGLVARKPAYQAPNIACAVAVAEEFLNRDLAPETLRESVMDCPTPGRFDLVRVQPVGLVDACHNPQSVEAFLVSLRAMEPLVRDRPTLLCAVLADKDVEGIVGLLAPEFPRVVCTQTDSPRALPAEELARLFAERGVEPDAVYPTVELALEALEDEAFVACGSITTAGAVAGILRG